VSLYGRLARRCAAACLYLPCLAPRPRPRCPRGACPLLARLPTAPNSPYVVLQDSSRGDQALALAPSDLSRGPYFYMADKQRRGAAARVRPWQWAWTEAGKESGITVSTSRWQDPAPGSTTILVPAMLWRLPSGWDTLTPTQLSATVTKWAFARPSRSLAVRGRLYKDRSSSSPRCRVASVTPDSIAVVVSKQAHVGWSRSQQRDAKNGKDTLCRGRL
jgi:hypothetical protein